MSKKVKAIKNPDNVCFKCLKIFNDNQLHKIKIPGLGYSSNFDNFSTEVHLCDKCIKGTEEWWKLEVINTGEYSKEYKFEHEIINFINTLPLEGRELFYNRYSEGANAEYMTPQDWIDYELDLLPHEKCKEYGLYSPEEKRAYQDRFPICKHVKIIKYNNGSKGCHCKFGAFGNEDGTAKGHQTQSECYECPHFELREGEIMTIDLKKQRILKQIEMLKKKLEELNK